SLGIRTCVESTAAPSRRHFRILDFRAGSTFGKVFHSRQIRQMTPLVPGHSQEIPESAPEAIPNAVLGLTGCPWAVIDGHFQDQGPCAMRQNRYEPMQTVERETLFQNLALENT